jgi:hypothetical protein
VNVLVTGQVGSGKDWVFRQIVHTLMARLTPEDIQVVIIDGKGLDYPEYDLCPFVVQAAHTLEYVPNVLAWLDQTVQERRDKLAEAKAKSWWSYYENGHRDMPYLLVYVSELTRLERFVDKFWTWLEDHLTTDRSYGISFVIGTQTASNMQTRWRRQCQLFIAGSQPSRHDDAPNTNRTTDEWLKAGVLAPSQLPLRPGSFSVAHGREMYNVRGVGITDKEEARLLERLARRYTTGPAMPVQTEPVSVPEPVRREVSPESPGQGLSGREPTLEEIQAWVRSRQRAGLRISQNAACDHFWGGKNTERMTYVGQMFAQLGIFTRRETQ